MQKPCTLCVGCGRCETYSKDINVLIKGGLSQKVTTFPCDVLEKVYEKDDALISVDIGTTTVAMTLRRLCDGEMLDTYAALNPQRAYGRDVLSRIEKENEHLRMKEDIEAVICAGIKKFKNRMTEFAEGGRKEEGKAESERSKSLKGMVVTGNTTMLYLLQGLPTKELSAAPFVATHLEQKWIEIGGLKTLLMPGISTFVGADILAAMFALSMDRMGPAEDESETAEGILLVDLGTNGEMVWASGNGLVATATPAAPAYEGGAGKAEKSDAETEEIMQAYGSDYVSFLAYLLEHEYMDETGLLAEPYFDEGIVVAGHKITQQDIRRLQLAKAATAAGVQILTENKVPSAVYLAGGFGYYLDGMKAERIGLLPKGFGVRSVAVGNLALEGAFLYGQSQFAKAEVAGCRNSTEMPCMDAENLAKISDERIHAMKEQTKVINLAMEPEFEKIYVENMNFPRSEEER